MAQRRATMITPAIEDLLDRVDSKFTLVTVSAKRARRSTRTSTSLAMAVAP